MGTEPSLADLDAELAEHQARIAELLSPAPVQPPQVSAEFLTAVTFGRPGDVVVVESTIGPVALVLGKTGPHPNLAAVWATVNQVITDIDTPSATAAIRRAFLPEQVDAAVWLRDHPVIAVAYGVRPPLRAALRTLQTQST